MKIPIPHLGYTVIHKPFTSAPKSIPNARAYVVHNNSNSCTIYSDKKATAPDLAHELVHVLQFICLDRNIDFRIEQEHMAYIMGYVMGKITGHSYVV